MPVFLCYEYLSSASISSLSTPVNYSLYHPVNSIWVFPFFFWLSFKKFLNNPCLIHSNLRVQQVQSLLLILPRSMCDSRRGLDWWIDLVITYTHDWELQAITVPPLISTIHKSPQHLLSLFQPAISSLAVPLQRLLTLQIIQLHALRSSLHSLLCRTELSTNFVSCIWELDAVRTENTALLLLCPTAALLIICCLATGTCLPSCCPETVAVYGQRLATGLYATTCCQIWNFLQFP
jgi:hypothetical protein